MEEDIAPWSMFEHRVISCRFWKDKRAYTLWLSHMMEAYASITSMEKN